MTGAEQQGPNKEVINDVPKSPEVGSTVDMTPEQFNARIAQLEKQIDELKNQRDANTAKHLKEIGNDDPTDPQAPADAKALQDQISGFSAESEEVIDSAKKELAELTGEPKESTTEISADMLAAVKTAIAESYYEKYYEKQTTTPQTPETRAAWIKNYENLLKDASLESLKTQPGFAEVIDGYLKEKSPKAGDEASVPETPQPEPTPQPVADVPKVPKESEEPKDGTTEISADMLAAVKTAIAESYYEKYYEKQTTTPQTPETRAAWIKNYENLLKDASLESLKTQPGFAEVIDGYLKEKSPKAGDEASVPETPQPVAEEPGEPGESEEAEENGDIPDETERTPTATPATEATTPEVTTPEAATDALSPLTPQEAQPTPTPGVFNKSAKATYNMGNITSPKTPDVPSTPQEAQKAPERQLSLREISNRSTEIRNLLKTPIESDQKTILTSEVNKLFDQSLNTGEVMTQFELVDSMNTLKQPERTKGMLSKMENKIVADSSFLPNQKADLLSIVALKYVAAKALTEANGALDKAKTQAESAKGFVLTENKNYKAALDAMKKQQNIDRFTIGNK